ncbi:pilus assembly protein [Agrobacterium salinitolerans]|uniref:Pilus assembly protein n=1 Tax=Agrobacterium salinitolerans TaxID=1183413 RepID=A0A9X3KUY1_9HYPH|nr:MULTISPECIES: TadE/TadG family type IV pilus assembly protein [Agrobacterium]MCZ7853822.1 pilus assembly protein [Agrobacterium salinitolerans]MCZ7894836.1 pilus assembly protein [Agrobacterium salinitolerans]MCZ7940753.1 pilus assembly protein [Agrobacterium salinitolerans]TRA82857.1 pilus assembly protein [Agrobacterium salinitolerans]
MSGGFQKLWRSNSGATAVEFALVMPVFLLLLFGIMEFGRMLWTSHALHDTAIATARCMGVPQLECEENGVYSATKAMAFAKNTAAGWYVSLDSASVTLDHEADCYGLAGFSHVKISHQFSTVVPSLLTSLAGGTGLRAEACFTNH